MRDSFCRVAHEMIRIRGARTHNLKNLSVELPTEKLIVITGVSGCGKSSLAFDTLFAEGQRRYLESVSVRTRSVLRQLPRPDVDEITGLAPTVSVDQRVSAVPVRSTLATTTEIHDYLRLLYARAGTAHCTACGQPVQRQSVDQILQQTLALPERTRLIILAPVVRARRGAHRETLERIARLGFVRARVDGQLIDTAELSPLRPAAEHTIEAVVDRIVIREGIESRLRESVELACREGAGTCIISFESDGHWQETFYSTRFSCPGCDLSFPTPEPRSFSFSSPQGACKECSGLGIEGAIHTESGDGGEILSFHERPCQACHGTRLQPFPRAITFLGMSISEFLALSVDTALVTIEEWIERLQTDAASRSPAIRTEVCRVAERTLPDIRARLQCLSEVGTGYLTLERPARTLSGGEFQRARLAASLSAQLHGAHLILDEPTAGLHPRDTQKLLQALRRLRDAGSTVIVVEHDEDLIRAADWLLDLGPGSGVNGGTLLFSGTPADAERKACSPTGDYLRDWKAADGTPTAELADHHSEPHSEPRTPPHSNESAEDRRKNDRGQPFSESILIREARLHNLRNQTVVIPLHQMVVVSGVSGSGKSSLILGTLFPVALVAATNRSTEGVCADVRCEGIDGLDTIRRVRSLDQRPVSRSPRSCVATLCGIWDEIRKLFAKTREARARGLSPRQFSFNSGDGRCAECLGTGIRNLRMRFLPDTLIPCPVCRGQRFRESTCRVRFRDKSVADVLRMQVSEAFEFFREFQRLSALLGTFRRAGLGYLTLGQPAATFSGGEAQRARLACELADPAPEHTLYILDEPTRGLHAADVRNLISHLRSLAATGHSVVVVEHHPDVIRQADWVIELGPDCADLGGEVVFTGFPEQLIAAGQTATAEALRR